MKTLEQRVTELEKRVAALEKEAQPKEIIKKINEVNRNAFNKLSR